MNPFDIDQYSVTEFGEDPKSWIDASLARLVRHWVESGRSLSDLRFDWVDGPEPFPRVIAVERASEPDQPLQLVVIVSARSWIWRLPGAIAEGPGQEALRELLWPAQEQVFLMECLASRESRKEVPDWIKDWPLSSQLRLHAAWPSLARLRGTASGLKKVLGALLGVEPLLQRVPGETRVARLGAGARLDGSTGLRSDQIVWRCRAPCAFGEDPGALRRRLQAVFTTERPLTVFIDLQLVDRLTYLGFPTLDSHKDETA